MNATLADAQLKWQTLRFYLLGHIEGEETTLQKKEIKLFIFC